MISQHRLGGAGDKETFLYGCLVTNASVCHMIMRPAGSGGKFMNDRFCGKAMIQRDPKGKIVFVHANLNKAMHYNVLMSAPEW